MTITKKKDGDCWRVHFDGRPSPITIAKGERAAFRDPQLYDVILSDADYTYLFEARSVSGAMSIIETIATISRNT